MPDLIPTRPALAQINADNQKLARYLEDQEKDLQSGIENILTEKILIESLPVQLDASSNSETRAQVLRNRALLREINKVHVVDEKGQAFSQISVEKYQKIKTLLEKKKQKLQDDATIINSIRQEEQQLQTEIANSIPQPGVVLTAAQQNDFNEKTNKLNKISPKVEKYDNIIQDKTVLEDLLIQIDKARQQEEAKIAKLQTLRTRLITDEDKKILALGKNNIKKAKVDLETIHDETKKLIPNYDPQVKKEIAQQLDNIQKQRTELLTTVDTKTSKDNAYIDLQDQMASLSADKNGLIAYQRNSNQHYDKDARDRLVKELETKKSFKHEGYEFFDLPGGGTQAAQDDDISARMLVDWQFSKMNKANENAQVTTPLNLFLIKGYNTSDETINTAAKHALAMGGNDIEIVDPDEDGDQWNKIFTVKANLKPTENDMKLFSATAQSNFALLITKLQHHENSEQLILKVLSALDNKQLVEVMDDLNAAAEDAAKNGNNHPEAFFKYVLSLLPRALRKEKPEFVSAVYADLKKVNPEVQAEAIKAYILFNLQKTSNRYLAAFKQYKKVAQGILQPLETKVLSVLDKHAFELLTVKLNADASINLEMKGALTAALTQYCPTAQQQIAEEAEQRQANQRRLAAEPVEEEQNDNSDDEDADDDDDELDSEDEDEDYDDDDDDDSDEEGSVKDTDEELLRKKPTKNKNKDDDDDDDELDSEDEDEDYDDDDDDDSDEEELEDEIEEDSENRHRPTF